jgi:hypothetical protein
MAARLLNDDRGLFGADGRANTIGGEKQKFKILHFIKILGQKK